MKIKLSKTPRFPTHIIFISEENAREIPDFQGETGEITVRYENDMASIYTGVGKKESCTTHSIRSSSARAIQKAVDLKRDKVTIELPQSSLKLPGADTAAMEGVILGSYKFSKYKNEKPAIINTLEVTDTDLSSADLRRIQVICDAVNYARDLVNENASIMTPLQIAEEAKELGRSGAIKVTILDEKQLQHQGLNLINAVGQGSDTPPRLVFLEYSGNKRSTNKTAIVGKGITFDSGGQNLKPTGHIETMRIDMAGAATVLATFKALKDLKPAINVVGVVAAAHNAISGKSFFPGDIYTSYLGKTVEINSTDAEGRLVLADAVAYCQKKYNPASLIDLATLTGGILYALGDMAAGLFSNNDDLAGELFKSGEKTGERLWRFPIYKEYCDSLKGDLSDLRNISRLKKGYASSITAAAFIKEFVQDIPWAHIDIAGTAFNEGSARGETPQFGTGFGVRLLLDYLLKE